MVHLLHAVDPPPVPASPPRSKPQLYVPVNNALPSLSFATSPLFPIANTMPVSALIDTKLSFDPPQVGHPTEITFTFTPSYDISEG